MLRPSLARKQKPGSQSCPLLIFSIGGRRLAVKTDEVAGISKWNGSIPVPSRTQFVSAVLRKDREILPVFDLASLLHVRVRGDELLCLTAKHPDGAMAICIDEEMPVLDTLDAAAIRAYRGEDVKAIGSYSSGLDEIPIISMAGLGSA